MECPQCGGTSVMRTALAWKSQVDDAYTQVGFFNANHTISNSRLSKELAPPGYNEPQSLFRQYFRWHDQFNDWLNGLLSGQLRQQAMNRKTAQQRWENEWFCSQCGYRWEPTDSGTQT